MIVPLNPHQRGNLIAHADDVANGLIEKWGRAVVSEPKSTDKYPLWHIEVTGLLGDIPTDVVLVFPQGSRILVA